MTVARVSSVHQPTKTGEKCQGTISCGTGTEGDIQAWSSSRPWSNGDEDLARWDWLGSGSWGWSTEHSRDFEWDGGWPVNLETPNLAAGYENLDMPQRRLWQRG